MRRANRIHVKGSDIPDLAENFSELQERLVGKLEWNWSTNADTDLILLPSSLIVKFVHPTIHLTFSLIGLNPGETFNGEVWLSKWGSLWGGLLLVIMTNNLTTIEEIMSGVEATLMMTSTKVFKTSVTQSSQLTRSLLRANLSQTIRLHKEIIWLAFILCINNRYKLASYMIENVTKRGYHKPTPIQMQAVPLMIHVSASWLNHYLVLYCHYMFWCKNLSANFWPTDDQQSGNIWGTVHPNPGQHGPCKWTGGWQSVTCWCSASKLSVSIIILPYILSKLQWKCWLQDVFYQVT